MNTSNRRQFLSKTAAVGVASAFALNQSAQIGDYRKVEPK